MHDMSHWIKRKPRKFLNQVYTDVPVILMIIGIGVLMFMALIGALT
jgi:hypothetical protein